MFWSVEMKTAFRTATWILYPIRVSHWRLDGLPRPSVIVSNMGLEFLPSGINRLIWIGENVDQSNTIHAWYRIKDNFMLLVTIDTIKRQPVVGSIRV